MAYDITKLTKLAALKALAEKTKTADDALSARIKTLEDTGSQANVLEGVKVNGTALAIAEKMVDILIAESTNNGKLSVNGVDIAIKGLAALAYKEKVAQADLEEALAQTIAGKADASNVYDKTAIDGMISSVYKPAGSVAFASLPTLAADVLGKVYNVTNAFTTTDDFVEGAGKKHTAGTNVVVVNTGTNEAPVYKFDVLSGFVDLSEYQKTTEADGKYVAKEEGKGLSANDYTTTEKEKLAGIQEGATAVAVPGTADGTITVNGVSKTVVAIATDNEVTEMLNEVFAPAQA